MSQSFNLTYNCISARVLLCTLTISRIKKQTVGGIKQAGAKVTSEYFGFSPFRMLTHNLITRGEARRIQNTHVNTAEKVKSSCEHVFHPRPETHRWNCNQQLSLSALQHLYQRSEYDTGQVANALSPPWKTSIQTSRRMWLHSRVIVQPIVVAKPVNPAYRTGIMGTKRDRGAARDSVSAHYRETDSLGHENV